MLKIEHVAPQQYGHILLLCSFAALLCRILAVIGAAARVDLIDCSMELLQAAARDAKRRRREECNALVALRARIQCSPLALRELGTPPPLGAVSSLVLDLGAAYAAITETRPHQPPPSELALQLFVKDETGINYASYDIQADNVGMSRKTFDAVALRLTSALWACVRLRRHVFASAIHASAQVRFLQVVDVVGYDETPLHLRSSDKPSLSARPGDVTALQLPTSISSLLPKAKLALQTKLFQIQQEWGFLAAAFRGGQAK